MVEPIEPSMEPSMEPPREPSMKPPMEPSIEPSRTFDETVALVAAVGFTVEPGLDPARSAAQEFETAYAPWRP